MARRPWFPFYVADFLADARVQRMDTTGVGAYLLLLCNLWDEGAVPNDLPTIRAITKLSAAQFKLRWPLLRACLAETEDGQLHQPRMTVERAKADGFSEEQARKADLRWEAHRAAAATAGDDAPDKLSSSPAAGAEATVPAEPELVTLGQAPAPDAPAGTPVPCGDDPDAPAVAPELVAAGCAAFHAARQAWMPTARRGSGEAWEAAMAELLAEAGSDEAGDLMRWLWIEYAPERPEFDWRLRVNTPALMLEHLDGLRACRRGQQTRASAAVPPAKPAVCSCGSTTRPEVDLDEDRMECVHATVVARLKTVRCADCQAVLPGSAAYGIDRCTDCWPQQSDQQARMTEWGKAAGAAARDRGGTPEPAS